MNKCILCHTVLRKTIQNKEFALWKCRNCGLVEIKCKSVISEQSTYSINYFIKDNLSTNKDGYSDYFKYKELRQNSFIEWIRSIKKHEKSGNLLDFGCGPGFFMEIAEKHGFNVFGVDIAQEVIELLKENFPDRVFCGSLKNINFPSNSFDVVTLFDSIEHLHHLIETMVSINKILKPNGLLAINTPNFDSWLAKLMKANWYALLPNEHIFLLTPHSIKYLLKKTGFKILEITPTYKTLNFDYMQKKSEINYPKTSRIIKMFSYLLPSKLYFYPFKVKTGEMFVFARKI